MGPSVITNLPIKQNTPMGAKEIIIMTSCIKTVLSFSNALLKLSVKWFVLFSAIPNKILNNTAQLSDSLVASDIKGTINNAKESLEEVNMILYDIKNGDGTLTRLINDSTVYLSVTQMIDEATRLVENIKTEPKRYVQFSIFGKKDKSILDSRDEKLLKKFAVDSLSFK